MPFSFNPSAMASRLIVLVFGNIRIVIQLVWDVEAGRRTLEMGHRQNMTALRRQAMI
jgi:hypothetical protein